jgi:hypothetical protein
MDEKITASEALFGFMGWLTCRREVTTLSAAHNADIAADLIKEWCEVNNLSSPRDGIYPQNITQPEPLPDNE